MRKRRKLCAILNWEKLELIKEKSRPREWAGLSRWRVRDNTSVYDGGGQRLAGVKSLMETIYRAELCRHLHATGISIIVGTRVLIVVPAATAVPLC